MIEVIKGRSPLTWHELHQKYGPVVRIAPDELSYNTAGAWRDIYGYRPADSQMNKDPNFFGPPRFGAPSIIDSNYTDHSRFRRLLSHAFSDRALREQEPLLQRYINLLIQRLHERCSNGAEPLDMVKWYNWTTFDIIGDLAFGDAFGCLKDSTYHPWVSIIFDNIKAVSRLNQARRYPSLQGFLARFIPQHSMAALRQHVVMTGEKVMQRLEKTDPRPDFLDHIIRAKNGKSMTVNEIKANSNVFIIAGSETTATVLSGTTYQLLRNPEVLQKLIEEVRNKFDTEDQITIASASELTYMLAILQETMRIYPAVPVAIPRQVPKEGAIVEGQFVPGNTKVGVTQWATYHSVQNFTDPERFAPERFLGDERYASDDREAFQPFSYGPRNCIGKK